MNNISFGAKLKIDTKFQKTLTKKVPVDITNMKYTFQNQTLGKEGVLLVDGFDKQNNKNIIFKLIKNGETLYEESKTFPLILFKNYSLSNVFFDMLKKYENIQTNKKNLEIFDKLLNGRLIGANTEETKKILMKYMHLKNSL